MLPDRPDTTSRLGTDAIIPLLVRFSIPSIIAQLVGIMFAIMMVRLLQSAGVEGAIIRTVRAGWNDIATRSNLTVQPDLRGWMARMLDRIALLAPRPGENILDLGCGDGVLTEKIVAAGATVVDEHTMGDFTWSVLTDPQGNVFCVAPH